jgi:hypothetical protein
VDNEQAIREFIHWLYDVSPVWPDQTTREELLRLYRSWQETSDDAEPLEESTAA